MEKPEHEESLWWLAAAPSVWAAHLLACYATVAVWCAKMAAPDGSLGAARIAVVVYSVAALFAVALTGRHAFRRHRFGTATLPHDFDTRADRHRFLGFATFLLSLLSALAIVYVALAFVFIRTCR